MFFSMKVLFPKEKNWCLFVCLLVGLFYWLLKKGGACISLEFLLASNFEVKLMR